MKSNNESDESSLTHESYFEMRRRARHLAANLSHIQDSTSKIHKSIQYESKEYNRE